jgi:hypothetical protein
VFHSFRIGGKVKIVSCPERSGLSRTFLSHCLQGALQTLNKSRDLKRSVQPEGLLPVSVHFFGIAALLCGAAVFSPAQAGVIYPNLSLFVLSNTNADGSVSFAPDWMSLTLTGGNNGSGLPGLTSFLGTATQPGIISFTYSYDSLDMPGFDNAGYLLDGTLVFLSDTAPDTGSASFAVSIGTNFGFYVATADNTFEPGVLSVTFVPPSFDGTDAPEPASALLGGSLLLLLFVRGRKLPRSFMALPAAILPLAAFAQTQNHYVASPITGQLSLTRTINLSAPHSGTTAALVPGESALAAPGSMAAGGGPAAGAEISILPSKFPHPPLSSPPAPPQAPHLKMAEALRLFDPAAVSSLTVAPSSEFGFQGVSHYDQRNANSGNQFSVEPPNPSIAVANGYVLEGVNNAVRVFSALTGSPLTATVASNELFGVAPAIDRVTGIDGVFPTDMRVFFDPDIQRWFVIQRSQDNDIFGVPLDKSHLYVAVSASPDPAGVYNIYVMDTTNSGNPGCPCVPDFPQIGADQYGFYISANEYNTSSLQFVDAEILAISKTALAAGAAAPGTYRFLIPRITGFEFAIQPASSPAGASQFLASGGVEYFVSSQSALSTDNHLAVWALSNTATLQAASASLLLTQTSLTTESYAYPDLATQRPGPLPYGSSLIPPAPLAFLDGGSDSRILSLVYAGGRLFATLAMQVTDYQTQSQVGGAYMILSAALRNGILSAAVLRQGYLSVPGNHLLRPTVAVNAQGRGAIAFTLVGPDYYPSAAFVSLDTVSTSSVIQIAANGAAPEDGFTGYPGGIFPGIARWGDYSTAVIGSDGAVWMVTEYIPSGPRTDFANWGTYVARHGL